MEINAGEKGVSFIGTPTTSDNMAEKTTGQTLWASFPPRTIRNRKSDIMNHVEVEMIKQITKFIEDEIPETIRRFSMPDGEEYVKKYYLEYFTEDGTQTFNLADMPSAFEVKTYAKNNYRRLLSSGKYKNRYKNYILKIDPQKPIKIHTAIEPIRATVHANLSIGGKDHGKVIYELVYKEKDQQWRIETTRESSITPDHLGYSGVFLERLIKPEFDSFNVVQRLLRFKYLFETLDLRKCFWEKVSRRRSKPEAIAESLIIGYLAGCADWDQIIPKPTVGRGIPDWLFITGSNRIGIEIKTDNFSSLVSYLKIGELDKATKDQLQRFCVGSSIDEMFLVLFHNHSINIKENYLLPIDDINRVYVITLDY